MSNLERNRRRNQIVAERSAARARETYNPSAAPMSQLWGDIQKALKEAGHTHRWLGHPDRCIQVVMAEKSLEEIRIRGDQLAMQL